MENIHFTFKNNGLGTYNDQIFDRLFNLKNIEYTFELKPNANTKFWRFGIRMSKTENIEFYHPYHRYKDPDYKKFIDINLGVGEWDGKEWSLPKRLHLAQYNLYEDPNKHILDRSETYEEYSKVEWTIKCIKQGSLYISYKAGGSPIFSNNYPLSSQYEYFKIFAWADEREFMIDCTIKQSLLAETSSYDRAKSETSSILFENAQNKENADPPSYDIKTTKRIASTLKNEIGELIQEYNSWYSVSENEQEDQFGKAIGRLLETCDNILSIKTDTHPTFNSRLIMAITIANTNAMGLGVIYREEKDQLIIKKFEDLLGWANEMVQNIINGYVNPYFDFPKDENDTHTSDSESKQEIKKGTVDFTTLRGRLLSDQATDNDLLGFSIYATAIAELIKTNIVEQNKNETDETQLKSTDTKAGKPFNIGIIAPWGHGKTTLMKNVQKELDPGYKHSDEEIENRLKRNDSKTSRMATTYEQVKEYVKEKNLANNEKINSSFPSVWFNAWRYQSSDQIWSGLGHAIISQLSSRLSEIEREKFWFKLQLSRVDILKVRQKFYSDLIRKMLPWLIGSVTAFIIAIFFFINGYLKASTFISVMGTLPTAIGYFKSIKDKIEGKVSEYFDEPDYSEKMGVYHNIIHDLHKVFSLVLKDNQRAIIFIDDLDRCSPIVIGEVFEAVNLMMVDPIIGKHCYFIFGMDAQVVAAALDNKYALMSGKLKEQESAFGSVGWYFLDKFIQLPFNVPIMSQDERLNLLKYYFNPEKASLQTQAFNNNETAQIIINVKEAMQEQNANIKQQKLTQVLRNIDEQDIEVKKEAVKEAVKEKLKENDSEEIISQLKFISPFLSSSPREIIRYINLLRFFNSTLFIRQSMMPDSTHADFKGVAKYLLIALKWPQLVRWIQWEGDDELVMYNTTKDKAKFLDQIIESFRKGNQSCVEAYSNEKNAEKPNDVAIQKSTEDLYSLWHLHCEAKLKYDKTKADPKKLTWLYDKQIMEVLINDDTLDSSFEKALLCKIW